MDVSGVGRTIRKRLICKARFGVSPRRFRSGGRLPWMYFERAACRARQRRTVAVSTVGVVLFVLLAPTLLPVWGAKCLGGALLSHLAALKLDTDVLAGLALAGDYIKDARDQLDEEEENLIAERDAFQEFAEEIQSLPTPSQPTGGNTTIHVTNTGTGRQLDQVRETYEKTVMAVPDYDEEYGESFVEHIAAEFGPDVATVVVDGHRFSEPVKQLLVEQARQSAQQRQELLDIIGSEGRTLRTVTSALAPARETLQTAGETTLRECNVAELVDVDSQLRDARTRCESVAEERQEEIHTETRRNPGDGTFLQEYLYRNAPFSFPVLRTAVEYIDHIEKRRTVLVKTLTRR